MLPYVSGQDEPSRPENVLIELPADIKARDQLLHKEWNNIFDVLDGQEVPTISSVGGYGDLSIGNGECFIFFTYVNVNAGWN